MSDDIKPTYPISPRAALHDLRVKHAWESMTDHERAFANRTFEGVGRHFSDTTLPLKVRIRTDGDRGRLLSTYIYLILRYEGWVLEWGVTDASPDDRDDDASITPLTISLPPVST